MIEGVADALLEEDADALDELELELVDVELDVEDPEGELLGDEDPLREDEPVED